MSAGDSTEHSRILYVEVLKENVKRLNDEIRELLARKRCRWMQDEAITKEQWQTIKALNKSKASVVKAINTLTAMNYQETGPMPCSTQTQKSLCNQVKTLSSKNDDLTKELSSTQLELQKTRKELQYAELCRKKFEELKRKSFLTEQELNSILQSSNELRISINEQREVVKSYFHIRSMFYKKEKLVKNVLLHGRNAIKEIVHAATIAHKNKSKEVFLKVSMLHEKTKVDQTKLGKELQDLRSLVKYAKTLGNFTPRKPGSAPEAFESCDPFLLQWSHLSYAEKRVRCDVILSRIKHVSGANDITLVCRKYSENEMQNRSIFDRVDSTMDSVNKLHHENQNLKSEIKHLNSCDERSLIPEKIKIKEITDATVALSRKASNLEGLVDAEDAKLAFAKRVLVRALKSSSKCDEIKNLQTSMTDDMSVYLERCENIARALISKLKNAMKQTYPESSMPRKQVFKDSFPASH